jgi:hypothetical protein
MCGGKGVKAFALSMWNVLMTVTNYVHWEYAYSRTATPKEVVEGGLIAAPLRPVHRNILIKAVTLATALALSVWVLAALIVAPALVGFFPVECVLLAVVPMVALVLPLGIISWIWSLIPDNVAQLRTERLLALQKMLKKIDADDDHSLSKEELRCYWSRATRGASDHSSASIEKMWEKLDQDHDGHVTVDEFMTAAGVGKEWKVATEDGKTPVVKKTVDRSVEFLLTAEPRLLLKIGLMQAFTTILLIAWFLAGCITGKNRGHLQPGLCMSSFLRSPFTWLSRGLSWCSRFHFNSRRSNGLARHCAWSLSASSAPSTSKSWLRGSTGSWEIRRGESTGRLNVLSGSFTTSDLGQCYRSAGWPICWRRVRGQTGRTASTRSVVLQQVLHPHQPLQVIVMAQKTILLIPRMSNIQSP